jgi:hypothetical protein
VLVIQGACGGGENPQPPSKPPAEPPVVSQPPRTTRDPQLPVTMKIEYKGGTTKHLQLAHDTFLYFRKSRGPVTWNVQILPQNPSQPIPSDLRANKVRLWSPLREPAVFLDSQGAPLQEITIGPFEYSAADNIGRASIQLTPNPDFPLVGNQDTTLPLAIYTDIDEGQDPVNERLSSRKNLFKQAGLQMVEGAHSHPEHKVGP